jgi:TPR repeat protein
LAKIDLERLAHGLTRSTQVELDAETMIATTGLPGSSPQKPFVVASAFDFSRWLAGWQAAEPAASLQAGSANPRLSEHGFSPLAHPTCASKNDAKNGTVVTCGADEAILGFGDAIGAAAGPLAPENTFEAELDARSYWSDWGISGVREQVPNLVDALLRPPDLGKSGALRLALYDLGFDAVSHWSDTIRGFARLRMAVGIDEQGVGHYRVSVGALADSALARALAAAQAKPAPPLLWQLPNHLESALYGDSSALAPLLAPSARALTLLAQAHADPSAAAVADAVVAAARACLVPNRSVLALSGSEPIVKNGAKAEVFESKSPARYAALGLEDPGARCATSSSALLKAYAQVDPGPGTNAKHEFELVKAGKGVPKANWVARFGSADQSTYVASWSNRGFAWLAWADGLPALSSSVAAVNSTGPKASTLAARPELAVLAKSPALVGGFASGGALSSAPGAPSTAARIPFVLANEGPALVVSGSIEPRVLREKGADFLTQLWQSPDWGSAGSKKSAAIARFLDATCHLGSGNACNALGVHLGDGLGVKKDVDRAREVLSFGCGLGQGNACLNSAFYGASTSEQLTAFRQACELRSASGCAWYGKRLLDSTDGEQRKQAIPRLEFACSHSSGFGCWRLGTAYEAGLGVANDDDKALNFEYRSCELGFGTGCIALGDAYLRGLGQKPNPGFAFKAYELACKLDKQNGCFALGAAYAKGIGTTKDLAAARASWTTACDAGHGEACRLLAEATDSP